MISITKNTYHKFEPFLYFRIPILLYIFYREKLFFYIFYILYTFLPFIIAVNLNALLLKLLHCYILKYNYQIYYR